MSFAVQYAIRINGVSERLTNFIYDHNHSFNFNVDITYIRKKGNINFENSYYITLIKCHLSIGKLAMCYHAQLYNSFRSCVVSYFDVFNMLHCSRFGIYLQIFTTSKAEWTYIQSYGCKSMIWSFSFLLIVRKNTETMKAEPIFVR